MSENVLNAILEREMKYDIYQNTFSPLFSSYGLQLCENFAGIKALLLHYNRSTRAVYDELMRIAGEVSEYIPRADSVKIKTDKAEAQIAFYAMDAFAVYCKTQEPVEFFAVKSERLSDIWTADARENEIILQGYSKNGDDRDPDKLAPLMLGLRVIKGKLVSNGKTFVYPDENGEIYLAVAADVLDIDSGKIKARLQAAPESVEMAARATQAWIAECVKNLEAEIDGSEESTVFIRAIIALIFNLTVAPGNLNGLISSFPNRGGYPTHFTWDSCFQNLAYEKMNPKIAEDSVLQLLANIRSDGKIPQFLCSTWGRPHDAQPALIGWAAERLFEQTGDVDFLEKIFEPLEKNNLWWLTQRITRFGVISCADGLETGQDNSPRFDEGTVLAVDMNSYLLSQLRATAKFARILGKTERAEYWENKSARLNGNMVKWLWDEEKNLFFDAYANSGEKQSLVTTSGLIPLWAGVEIPREKAEAMIREWLLNPKHFYGAVPFPSVAYSEKCYDACDWWRGPTWMPEAWLMLEVLQKYGFEAEYQESTDRLYNLLLNDGVLHELFNSQTAAGMGNVEQGWTAAIYIAMYLKRH